MTLVAQGLTRLSRLYCTRPIDVSQSLQQTLMNDTCLSQKVKYAHDPAI